MSKQDNCLNADLWEAAEAFQKSLTEESRKALKKSLSCFEPINKLTPLK